MPHYRAGPTPEAQHRGKRLPPDTRFSTSQLLLGHVIPQQRKGTMASKGKQPAASGYVCYLSFHRTRNLGGRIRELTGTFRNSKDATPTNPRGIPYAPFVDKVEDYVSSREDVEPTLRSFQEMIA